MLGSEWVLALVDSAGSTTQAAANTYDQWQEVRVTRTMNAGATYAYPQIQIASAASINEIWYNDAIEIEPADQSEATDNSLFHLIAKRGWRRQIQFLSNNSFENATIGNSWLVTPGGTLNKDAADGLFGSASGELIPGAAAKAMYQIVTFNGTKKLNVGETYTLTFWLKSTAAATGANNYILLQSRDSGGLVIDNSVTSYTLAGGEGWVKYSVSRTMESSDTDRLYAQLVADAGDAINIDGAMLIQSDRALDYFEVNALDGTAGVSLADLGPEISWPWFGIKTGNVDYYHPWRRMEINTTTWQNVKSVGAGTNARYCGYDENNTLINYSILDNDYGDRVPIGELTENYTDLNYVKHDQLLVRLDDISANRLYGVGVRYEKGTIERLIWLASASGNFTESTADQQLNESVAVGDYWPDPLIYAEYWAEYGVAGNIPFFQDELTRVVVGSYYVGGTGGGVFQIPGHQVVRYSSPFVPVSKRDKIVGIQDAALIHKTDDAGDGDGTLDYVNSGRIVSGLDILSRAGQAQILLQNNTAGTRTVIDCAIVGKAVYKFTGKDGYIHDAYIDREDIAKNGERLIQFGGEDVIDGTPNGQLDRIADYIWKDRGQRKHVYVPVQQGAQHDLSPAEWMKMNIGDAGETENIKGTAEIIAVRISAEANARGVTQVTYRELEEAWKHDSNAAARFAARGVSISKPGGGGAFISIGSEFLHDATDIRIPQNETAAETYIESASNYLYNAYGGGEVHLSKGTFTTTTRIDLKPNIRLTGEGDGTIIKRVGIAHHIALADGCEVHDLKLTRTTSDTGEWGILASGKDDIVISNITMDGLATGMLLSGNNCKVSKITILNPAVVGIQSATIGLTLSDIFIDGNQTVESALSHGISLSSGGTAVLNNIVIQGLYSSRALGIQGLASVAESTISNVKISDIDCTGGPAVAFVMGGSTTVVTATSIYIKDITTDDVTPWWARGIDIGCSGGSLSDAFIDNVDNTGTAATAHGIFIDGDNNTLSACYVENGSGTGILIDAAADKTQISSSRSTGNGTNFTDNGTNTTAAVEDS
jgi:hypothetical protein